MRITPRRLFAAVTICAGLAVGALGACASEEPPPPVERVERPRGPASVVIETALSHGDLSVEQRKAVEAIALRLEAGRADRQALREELRAAAGEVVRTGETDDEQFRQAVDRAALAIEERVELSLEAVVEIHALLSSPQRALVAEGLRDRIDQRWGRKHRDRHEGFKDLVEHLMLEPHQVDKLEKIRDELLGEARRLRPTASELYDLVDAFEGDDFPAALRAFHADKSEILRAHLAKAGGRADMVLSLLDADQRDLLADLVERGPEALRDQE